MHLIDIGLTLLRRQIVLPMTVVFLVVDRQDVSVFTSILFSLLLLREVLLRKAFTTSGIDFEILEVSSLFTRAERRRALESFLFFFLLLTVRLISRQRGDLAFQLINWAGIGRIGDLFDLRFHGKVEFRDFVNDLGCLLLDKVPGFLV